MEKDKPEPVSVDIDTSEIVVPPAGAASGGPDIVHADDAATQPPTAEAGDTGAGGDSPPVIDTDAQNFARDVIEASQGDTLVLLDFWAPWCGPCKELTPMLEELAQNSEGRVRLVKVNIDENAAMAQQLQVRSVPTVFAFKNGQPVDGFVGAMPKSELETFINKHVSLPEADKIAEQLAAAAEALDANEAAKAEGLYLEILRRQPRNAAALAGLALCYLAQNDDAQAREVLDMVAPEDQNQADVAKARARLELAKAPKPSGDIARLEAKIKNDPKDLAARFELAMAHHSAQQADAAITALLEILRLDAKWNNKAAHKKLLQFFDAYGADHPAVQAGRKELSGLLFR